MLPPLCLFCSTEIQEINLLDVMQHHRGYCQNRVFVHMETQITRDFMEKKENNITYAIKNIKMNMGDLKLWKVSGLLPVHSCGPWWLPTYLLTQNKTVWSSPK